MQCIQCGTRLTPDDIGLHRKLINRGAQEFLCMDCLAKKFNVERAELERSIEQFKKQGCTLFV